MGEENSHPVVNRWRKTGERPLSVIFAGDGVIESHQVHPHSVDLEFAALVPHHVDTSCSKTIHEARYVVPGDRNSPGP